MIYPEHNLRYVCIHGHFYQPPRENPWLEHIELQDSAHPYHDWNERIAAQCYSPNARARILGEGGLITSIVNNYARISFNFGATLLSWLEMHTPETYRAILEADKQSQAQFSGHGNAVAQAYCHMILPLANRRDKYTQVLWGLRDFKRRFGRNPEGMWLPEMAVDLETLDIMAELGIKYTLLAPKQAAAVSRIGTPVWTDVTRGRIDTTMPYLVRLAAGRQISVFFYDGPIAHDVAFAGLLSDGEKFARRLVGTAPEKSVRPALVNIATDGESYGHHHRFGEMALAYALQYIETNELATITNYGEYLEKHPPTHEVRILENTAWSCAHGIERWRSNCGDNGGRGHGWTQEWRGPLREAFDWLRDEAAGRFETLARQYLKEPWVARNDYVSVIADRSEDSVNAFLDKHASKKLDPRSQVYVLKLLELQRHAMLMYSSDGWFFDEVSDIETMQVIQHAGRVVQLTDELFGGGIRGGFLERLARAKSNLPEHGDARRLYEKFVDPAIVDTTKVAGHYAVSSMFNVYGRQGNIYAYNTNCEDLRTTECGNVRSAVGRVTVRSNITFESASHSFGVIHLGDQNLNAGVGEYRDQAAYDEMAGAITESCLRADFPQTIRLLDRYFGNVTYSLRSLFRDEQREIIHRILESALKDSLAEYRQVFQRRYPLMRFLMDSGYPQPAEFRSAADMVLNSDLTEALGASPWDTGRIQNLLKDLHTWNVPIRDAEGLGYLAQETLDRMMRAWSANPGDTPALTSITNAVESVRQLPFPVDLWNAQNVYYELKQTVLPGMDKGGGGPFAGEWLECFRALGQALSIKV